MRKAKFLSDYRGVKSSELFYVKDSIVELGKIDAAGLEEMGVIEIFEEVVAESKIKVTPEPEAVEPDVIEPKAKAKAKPKKKVKK